MLRVLRETKYLSNMQLHTSEEALKWKLDEEIQIYLRSSSGGQTVWLRCTVGHFCSSCSAPSVAS